MGQSSSLMVGQWLPTPHKDNILRHTLQVLEIKHNPRKRENLEDPSVNGRIILYYTLKKYDGGVRTGFIWLRMVTVVGCCERGTEQSGSIKMRGITRPADELLACHTSVLAVSYFDKTISRTSSAKRCCNLRTPVQLMSHDVPLGFRCQVLVQVKYASGVTVVASDRAGFEPEHGSITILRILRNFLLSDTTSHLQQDCGDNLKHGHAFISHKRISSSCRTEF